MATPTSSSNRSKRKGTKPITQGQNPQRGNRQKVSNAQVTNSTNRGSNTGSAKVTTGRGASAPKPADPWKAPTTKNSRTSAPKGNTTFRTQNTALTLPNSRAQGTNLPRAGAQQLRTATQGPRAASKPNVKPSGNFKAPNIPKPTPTTAKPNALTRNLRFGRGNAAAMVLGAANAADDARLTPAQLRKKYETVNPERGQNLLTKFQNGTLGQPDAPRPKPGNAQSRFAGAREANLNRINNDPRFAAPKAQGKPKAEKEKDRAAAAAAPSLPRAVTAPRTSRPASTNTPTSSPTLRNGEDQKKNRGSYATQFKEETGRMAAASMVRQQNRGNMTSEDLKPKQNNNIQTKPDGTTTVYEPKTKINTPNYSKKPIDQAKVDEYGRRKKRYYS